MVQPLPPVPANGRPECLPARPGFKPITTGKYEEFRIHLRRFAERAAGSVAAEPSAGTRSADAAHSEREISARPELPPSLAPEDQPSLGQGGGDLAEWFSLINPSGGVEAPHQVEAPAPPSPPAAQEVAELVERWVRRVALGGDQRRGAVRLDFGHGRFSGAELVVVADAGRVSVELSLPPAMAATDLAERLRSRLERRGIAADVVVR
jgi:hypothetical protein